ncbi:MAG: Fis family transcriptional regulator [Hyphomicrobiales bacterium]|nr:Fis family transcriptional regulator [Hyphomicrobiales bacterium]
MTSRRTFLACAAAVMLTASGALAQSGKTVTLLVPFAAGGGNDILARELGHWLIEPLKANVIIDNRGGAGGLIAAKAASTAAPNGLTLMFVSSSFVTTTAVRKKEPYDVEKDFTPIAMIARGPLLVVASHASGLTSVRDVVARSKAKPGSLNFVSSGVGSILHLATEVFMKKAGISMTHVPYTGSGPALMDLVAGRADLFVTAVPTVLGQLQDKSLNLLAVTSDQRSPLFPDAPTLAEQGVPGADLQTWWGVVGPPAMPDDLVAQINAAVNLAAASPAMTKRFSEEGATSYRGTSAEFAKLLKIEHENWRKAVEDGDLYTN